MSFPFPASTTIFGEVLVTGKLVLRCCWNLGCSREGIVGFCAIGSTRRSCLMCISQCCLLYRLSTYICCGCCDWASFSFQMSSKVDFVRQNLDNKLLNGVLVDTVVNEILRNPTMELWQLLEQLDYMHTTVNLVTLFSGEYSLECFNKLSQKMTVDQLFKLWDKNKDNHVFERLIEKLVQEPNRRKVFDVCCSLMHLRDDPSFYLLMLKDHENELSSGLVNLKSQSEIKNYTKEFFARLESVSSKARCSMFQVWCQLQPDHELQFMFYQFLPFDPEAQDRLLQILIDDHVLQIRNDDPSKEKLQFLESLYLKMTVRLAECSQKMILLHPEAVMKRVESLLELQSIALNQDLFQLYEKQDLAPFLDCLVQWDLDPKFFAFVDNRLNKLLNTKISGLVDHLSSFLTKKTKKARTSTKTRTVCQLLALCLKHLDDLPLYKSVFESLDFNQDNSLVLVQLMHNESFCRDNLSYKWLKTQDLGHQVICLFAKSIYRTDDKQVKKLTKLLKPKTQEDLLPVLTHLHVFGQYLEPETVRGWVKRFCGYLSKNDPAQNLPCTMVLFHQEFYESKLVHESISQVLSECDWTLDLVKHLLFFPLKYLDSQLIESKIFQINNLELKLKMLARHCTKQVEWIPYSGYDNFYQEYMNRAVR
ncbi:hypothetical protein EDD86DRAFT_19157 [Gorgonomyces haynaldii]|nr:hypothetical protein EDD86DRAFT_19157 [Gorgonomyces haynaldii]